MMVVDMRRSMLAAVILSLLLVGCANPASSSGTLIGTWGISGTPVWTFNSDLTCSSSQGPGTFTYTSTTIIVTYSNTTQPVTTMTYSISGNYLTLTITTSPTQSTSTIFTRMS